MLAKQCCVLKTQESSIMHLSPLPSPTGLGCYLFYGAGSIAVDILSNVLCFALFCYALLCVRFSFAINLKRKRKQAALLLMSYTCRVT